MRLLLLALFIVYLANCKFNIRKRSHVKQVDNLAQLNRGAAGTSKGKEEPLKGWIVGPDGNLVYEVIEDVLNLQCKRTISKKYQLCYAPAAQNCDLCKAITHCGKL